MQNQGMIFAGEGPLMQGTWYNPQNGDSFTVRDSFFENNQYLVTTTDGRTLNYNQLQNYVKSDKPINMQKSAVKQESIPSEIEALIEGSDDGMLPEDAATLGNLYIPDQNTKSVDLPNGGVAAVYQNTFTAEPDNKNTYIIEKALSKTKTPELDFNIKWSKFPEREINMLVELMDISKDEIIDWYISKMDTNMLLSKMSESLKGFITNKIDPQVDDSKSKPVKKAKDSSK